MTAVRYIAKTGSNSNDGLTRATAWLTISKALTSSTLAPGTHVKIGAGTYTESVVVNAHGEAGAYGHRFDPDHWLLVTADDGVAEADVVVDGVGNRAAFYLSVGCATAGIYARFSGFTVSNSGGATFTTASAGFEIGNSGAGGPTSAGMHHVEIACHFMDVNRNTANVANALAGFGMPIMLYGQADTRVGGTPTHHISLRGSTFGDSWLSTPLLLHSHVSISGCVQHVDLSDVAVMITRAADSPGQLTTVDSGALTVNVVAAAKTYTRTTGSWIVDGFSDGMIVTAMGFANAGNNGRHTIDTVDATVMTMTSATGLVNETGSGDERVIKGVESVQGGLEISGNQIPGSYPDQPTWIYSDGYRYKGAAANGAYALYITACKGILFERFYFERPTWGLGVVAERGSNPGNTSEQIWIRDGVVFDSGSFAVAVGAFPQVADGYDTVTAVWVTNLTLRETSTTTALVVLTANTTEGGAHGVAGINGDSYVGANIVEAVGDVLQMTLPTPAAGLLDRNLWRSAKADPFLIGASYVGFPYAADQDANGVKEPITNPCFVDDAASREGFRLSDTAAAVRLGRADLPAWALVFGAFGDYAPRLTRRQVERTDLYGHRRVLFDSGAAIPTRYKHPDGRNYTPVAITVSRTN